MDNFQAIGQLVTEARNLLDAIKGGAIRQMEVAFETLKTQFNDKLSSVNGELSAFVNQQKALVNTIFTDPDSRYARHGREEFKVGGRWDTFYPVYIPASRAGCLSTVQISRGWVHTDSGAINGLASDTVVGGLTFLARYVVGAYGNAVPVTLIDIHNSVHHEFIAKVKNDYRHSGLIVWLRGGGVTYELSHDKRLNPVKTYTTETGTLELAVYEGGFNSAHYGTFAPITEIDPDLFKGVK